MKALPFLSSILLLSNLSFGQQDFRKRAAIGINSFLNDFKPKVTKMKLGLGICYMEGLNNCFDFVTTLSGSFLDYPNKKRTPFNSDVLLLDLSVTGNLKLLSDNHNITPFVTTGIGLSKYKTYFGAFIPAGVGLQINYRQEIFALFSSQYCSSITRNVSSHFYHSIGVAGNIIRKKILQRKTIAVPQLPITIPPLDMDGDGIPDSIDRCPTVPGKTSLRGCPDNDGDGIADIDDRCPGIPGKSKYQGCPIPDTDKDGINDEEDSCVTTPGPANNHGCPVISKTINERLNIAAKNIFFASGSNVLLPKSFEALDEVSKLLTGNNFTIIIQGHTDNSGSPIKNNLLSEKRANAVLKYLKDKGIEAGRMKAIGFGQDKPVVDNATSEGRSQNRRVEININGN